MDVDSIALVSCENTERQIRESSTLWSGLLVCIMETLVPEDASKTKEEVEGADDEVLSITSNMENKMIALYY